ncbi:toprim domain-containing protein [Acetobacter senegalensis]|uniref:DUF7146 domain-containing protein n=1 Tax=Acetobacter senegalensis TaxID=446692 RepID=UPI001EDAD8FE|nr:toprim domain-containing protein [Acetobacter senegalensis]MCG4260278.1 toprim domain-containing protein [Acetobacter senegalensis]
MRRHSAGQISQMLAVRIQALVAELLPAGRRDGHEWRCGSLAGERGQSLAVHIGGARAGVWCDFAGGQKGDALDLVAHCLFSGSRRDAMAWAENWLGLNTATNDAPVQRRPAIQEKLNTSQELDKEAQRMRAKARRLWQEGQPIQGTPADSYLLGRGLDLRALPHMPGSLRFHPAAWCAEAQRTLPCMLGAIASPAGKLIATHRTWLQRMPSGAWVKADLRAPKKVLGSFAGGSVRLTRGASGKALGIADAGSSVIIAEGIETSLAVALSCPEMRVLAGVSLSNMGAVGLPPEITTVIIAADNDGPNNHTARKALETTCQKFAEQGREVRLALPENKGDWADVFTKGQEPKQP